MDHNKAAAGQLSSNYGLEIPEHLRHLVLVGLTSGVIGIALAVLLPMDQRLIAVILLLIGFVAIVITALLGLVTNSGSRLTARHKMINAVAWSGNEMVLDVGCGNGFLLVEAAKHLTTGKAIGIDVWREGSGGQNADAAWENARLEGVLDRIDVQNVDARKLPFDNESFDVILSSLALHHMGTNADREQALREMSRVLKPRGTILIYDMFPMTNQALAVMRQENFRRVQQLSGAIMRVLSASK